ncbi:anaerobic ribonucleoside-triphosphate reductase activating protein [Candidatus Bipolaricaulota bacterium]|nr:anaerobic ribonucleoside-triphosphate reductase activating protein [Candidatus Bipolaricaulota bacterium]
MMRIRGAQGVSLIDYPGSIAYVVFTQGCSFRCPYCHNPELVLPDLDDGDRLSEEEVLSQLSSRRGFLDAVVLTGGEPTIHADLFDFAAEVKALGFSVKLDSNGSCPDMLARMAAGKLVDYFALDVKAPRHRYPEFAGVAVDATTIETSIRIVRESGALFEYRTTVAPGIELEDLEAIAAWLQPAPAWYLQPFSVPSGKRLLDRTWERRSALSIAALFEAWPRWEEQFARGGVRG